MNKVIRNIVVLALGIGVLGACTSGTSEPLPSAASEFPAEAPPAGVVAPVAGAPAVAAPAPATAKPAAAAAKPAASSCEVVREALLTGSQTDIKNAMTQLQADKTADAKAREYASEYLLETNKDMQSMNVTMIRMFCS